MISYFAAGDGRSALKHLGGLHVLVSFAYVGTSWLTASEFSELGSRCAGMMIDSGAFTIWRKGGTIELESYLSWLSTVPRFDWAIGLDVIGDAEASVRNYDAARKIEPRIVPVWHEGDPVEHLDHYVHHAGLVGLGRIAGRRSEPKSFEFYDEAFNAHPGAKYHALGNANPATLEPYPFASFDSTGWQRDAAYSNAAKWPLNRCSKDTRIRAYIEATLSIEHRPPKQPRLFGWREAMA